MTTTPSDQVVARHGARVAGWTLLHLAAAIVGTVLVSHASLTGALQTAILLLGGSGLASSHLYTTLRALRGIAATVAATVPPPTADPAAGPSTTHI